MLATQPAGERDSLFFHQLLAHHEAGHAVCGYALGFGCNRIVMCETYLEEGIRASCAYFGAETPKRRVYADLKRGLYSTQLANYATTCAAGPAAERRFSIENGLALRTLGGAINDHEAIEAVGKRLSCVSDRSSNAFRRMIWHKAQKLIANPATWGAIRELATNLIELMPLKAATEHNHSSYEIMKGAAARAIIRRAGIRPTTL